MIKALILDADGVLLQNPKKFSQRYSEKFAVPIEQMLTFFDNQFQDCILGKKDLKLELQKVLPLWGWEKSVDELMDFWLLGESNLNQSLLDFLPKVKAKGVKIFLGTNNEKYRAQYIVHNLDLKRHLDSVYASWEVGYKKPSQEYFQHIINDLKLIPGEILFVDDDPKNVEGAKQAGMNAELYSDLKSFQKSLKNYL